METFSALLAICAGNSPLMFSLICAGMDDWVHNRGAGDLRRQHTHYDATPMMMQTIGLALWQYHKLTAMKSRHGSVFLALCEGNPPVIVQWNRNAEFWCVLSMLVIWNVITFIWLHCNIRLYFLEVLSRKSNAYKWGCFRYHQLDITRQWWHTLRRCYDRHRNLKKQTSRSPLIWTNFTACKVLTV